MTQQPWILEHSTWKDIAGTTCGAALLPWGATEAHNTHLPYGTDTIQCTAIARESARLAWEGGARVIALPAIPLGVQTGQLDIPFCINVNPSTQLTLLRDIAKSLAGQGVPRLVILNGHGGNEFRAIVRELQPQVRLLLCVVDWYRALDPRRWFNEPGDHAGEMETSLMLHLAPDLVRPLNEAGEGRERKFTVRGMREGWAWAPRHWRSATADTGVGSPRGATEAHGAEYFAALTRHLADFLVELCATPTGELYEQGEDSR